MMEGALSQSLVAGMATDVGRVRAGNEDACLADAERGMFIVSDGMGGAQAGALASRIVVGVLPKMIEARLGRVREPRARAVRFWLRHEILNLSQRLRRESAGDAGLKGMGATLALALVREGRAHVAHMGDSRAYLFRDGQLAPLTDDHSIVGILLRAGEITPEEAKSHPARGRLSRYIGMEGEVYPDIRTIALKAGDRLLLCTDGLTGMVADAAIASILTSHPDPRAACEALVDAANRAGGEDNVTAVVADIAPGPTP